jgi:hypothetical protein
MILDYAAKAGQDRLTLWARCKIAGLAVLLVACLWGSAGFIGESVGREPNSDVVVVPQVGEPPRRGSSETERRTAMLAAAMSLGGAMICAVSIVRTRNRPESHRWVG